jgi:hypothetical protein
LARGDLFAKLGGKERARECYVAAHAAVMSDQECRRHVEELVHASLASLGEDKKNEH